MKGGVRVKERYTRRGTLEPEIEREDEASERR